MISQTKKIKFASTNFFVNNDFEINAKINCFRKAGFYKLSGRMSNSGKVSLVFSEKIEEEITQHRFEGRLYNTDSVFSAPYIEGTMINSLNGKISYKIKIAFEDLTPFRILKDDPMHTALDNLVFINPRYMVNHLFGFGFINKKLVVINGKSVVVKSNDTEEYMEFYQMRLSFDKGVEESDAFLIGKKFTKESRAFYLSGKSLDKSSGTFRDFYIYSAAPQDEKWEEKSLGFLEPFYKEIGLKFQVLDFGDFPVDIKGNLASVTTNLINMLKDRGYLMSKNIFREIFKSLRDSDTLQPFFKSAKDVTEYTTIDDMVKN